ncbi:MAG: lipoyl(octanoyl) transferase [Methanobacteriota archaeon]|nr:MAG: lipoyl(octanoyl) transferase [Euryarchaeota archaeon]
MGIIEHENADSLMKEYQQMRINDKIPDTLLICEHPEIVTIGPRAKNDGIRPPVDYHSTYVDRGGGLTWHGPGQIVVYPIFKWNLEGESNVKSIIHMIEEWVIQSLNSMGVESRRDERMQGVWIGDNKICSIGLSFLRWTSRHGFTINYDTPEGRVEMVSGCGLGADTTTSLSKLGFDLTKEQIVQALFSNINMVNRELANQD